MPQQKHSKVVIALKLYGISLKIDMRQLLGTNRWKILSSPAILNIRRFLGSPFTLHHRVHPFLSSGLILIQKLFVTVLILLRLM